MRAGMAELIERWRGLVDDQEATVWDDDQAQAILDAHRVEIVGLALEPLPQRSDGEVIYRLYRVGRENLEEASSGSTAWRLYDAQGSALGTADYKADYQTGLVTFTADQRGSARYVDARCYDLYAAAADGWRQRAAREAKRFRFMADGATFERQQFYEHCVRMAELFDARAGIQVATFWRSDLC